MWLLQLLLIFESLVQLGKHGSKYLEHVLLKSCSQLEDKFVKFDTLSVLLLLRLVLLLLFLYWSVYWASLDVSVEALHGLTLGFIHLEVSYLHFVLIYFATRFHLVSNVDIGSTACEALLQQGLVIVHSELVRRESQLMIHEILLLFPAVQCPLPVAVRAIFTSFSVVMRPSKENRSLVSHDQGQRCFLPRPPFRVPLLPALLTLAFSRLRWFIAFLVRLLVLLVLLGTLHSFVRI